MQLYDNPKRNNQKHNKQQLQPIYSVEMKSFTQVLFLVAVKAHGSKAHGGDIQPANTGRARTDHRIHEALSAGPGRWDREARRLQPGQLLP
jgi:hypothetical protein